MPSTRTTPDDQGDSSLSSSLRLYADQLPVVLSIPNFRQALKDAAEALDVATDLLREEGYDTDPDYRQEWATVIGGSNA